MKPVELVSLKLSNLQICQVLPYVCELDQLLVTGCCFFQTCVYFTSAIGFGSYEAFKS